MLNRFFVNRWPIALLTCACCALVFLSCANPAEEQKAEPPSVVQEAPPQEAEASWPPLPEYRVHRRNPYFRGGQQGHIIVPSGKELSRDSLIQVLTTLAKKERLKLASFYTDTLSYRANMSASFNAANPGHLERGFLGSVEDDQYSNVYE